MNAKSWRRFWRELVRQRKPKLELPNASGDNIRQYMLGEKFVRLPDSRSMQHDRSEDSRAARLGRVVRLLHEQGWAVAVWSDGCLHIWDAKFPPRK